MWDASALSRGNLTAGDATGEVATARYIVRGGAEKAGNWWVETVDLETLYRRAWPTDDFRRARITFVGLSSVEGGDAADGMVVAGIRLSR